MWVTQLFEFLMQKIDVLFRKKCAQFLGRPKDIAVVRSFHLDYEDKDYVFVAGVFDVISQKQNFFLD